MEEKETEGQRSINREKRKLTGETSEVNYYLEGENTWGKQFA